MSVAVAPSLFGASQDVEAFIISLHNHKAETVLQSSHKMYCLKLPKIQNIHLTPKWRPINNYYSSVCMLVSPLCLIFTAKFFCVFYMLTRHQGLINMQTKE